MASKYAYGIVAVAVFAVAGCERRSQEITPPTPAEAPKGGGPVSLVKPYTVDESLSKIAEARCDREQTCNNIGADKKFADRTACVDKVRKDFADELNVKDCTAGVNVKELDECLAAARAEECKNPFDKLSRVAACRTSDICEKK
jgi:hypothetical protein